MLVAFYFPPAGGVGVQRPLRLAEHLVGAGVEVDVLAPDDPRWLHRDEGLVVPDGVRVHRARYLGPAGRRPAEELYGLVGVRRLAKRAMLTPRRFLVPDENVSWLLTALPAAVRIVRQEQIDVVVTTSPPISLHLLGAAVKRLTGVCWVADLRDSIVAKEDRRVERRAVRAKEAVNRKVANVVAARVDHAVCMTATIAAELQELNEAVRTVVIPNGCDFDEFDGLKYHRADRFRITHTGSFFGARSARPFLQAVQESGLDIVCRFVGDFRRSERDWATQLGLSDKLELIPFQPRQRTLELQRDTEALLLLLPEIGPRGLDIPSGKIYEYLAAGRPILATVPPEGSAAHLIRQTHSGQVVPPDDIAATITALHELHSQWQTETLKPVHLTDQQRAQLDRHTRSQEYAALLHTLTRQHTPHTRLA